LQSKILNEELRVKSEEFWYAFLLKSFIKREKMGTNNLIILHKYKEEHSSLFTLHSSLFPSKAL